MKKKVFMSVLAILTVVLMVAGCAPAATDAPPQNSGTPAAPATSDAPSTGDAAVKVAILLPGSANDNSWNQMGYDAIKAVETQLGAEIAYSENVTATDQLQAMRDYATKGYKVVFGHGGQFEDDMIKAAAEFPDTDFVVVCGSVGGDSGNICAVDTAPFQYGYTYGWFAGKITKTGKVGFVTAMEGVQTMNNLVGGWRNGVKDANPNVEATAIYISDMSDVAAAREAAIALAGQGCDVIIHELNAGTQGVVDVCKEKGIATVGRTPADVEYAPDQVLTYCAFDWGSRFVSLVQQSIAGEFPSGVYYYGLHTETPGWICTYDATHEWNPAFVTPEMLDEYNTDVVAYWKANPIKIYTAEDAKGGTF